MKTDFIYFTKSERRGILIFFASILIITGLYLLATQHRKIFYSSANVDILAILEEEGVMTLIEETPKATPKLKPQIVDPNQASLQELEAIGMSNYAAKSLIGYRKFNHITSEENLAPVYGIDSSMLNNVRQYLEYPKKPSVYNKPKEFKQKIAAIPINPNTASVQQLMGIGFSKFSSNNIIKLRAKGGSIKTLEEVKLIYGVDDKTFNQVKDLLILTPVETDSLQNTKKSVTDIFLPKTKSVTTTDSFNPNTASIDELLSQGIQSKVAYTLIKFRNGKEAFKTPDDLLKVYGITPSLLDSLRDRIIIPMKANVTDTTSVEFAGTIDLSTTTAEELIKIDGIGTYFSKAIIEYRDKLGGYYNIEQLSEVPAMKDEVYLKIKDKLTISGKIRKFVPIALEFKEALKHPYMDYKTTQLLFNLSAVNYNVELDKLIKKGMVDSRLIPYLLAD